MNRMKRLAREPPKWKCGICDKEYKLIGALSNHIEREHGIYPYGNEGLKLAIPINRQVTPFCEKEDTQ